MRKWVSRMYRLLIHCSLGCNACEVGQSCPSFYRESQIRPGAVTMEQVMEVHKALFAWCKIRKPSSYSYWQECWCAVFWRCNCISSTICCPHDTYKTQNIIV
jgi:hypothetical protein